MRITRVQVPDFRILHGVDLSFEQELTPQVFPLGSQNGGGKSTLLQLLFILVRACPGHHSPESELAANLLEDLDTSKLENCLSNLFCELSLKHQDRSLSLKFEIIKDSLIPDPEGYLELREYSLSKVYGRKADFSTTKKIIKISNQRRDIELVKQELDRAPISTLDITGEAGQKEWLDQIIKSLIKRSEDGDLGQQTLKLILDIAEDVISPEDFIHRFDEEFILSVKRKEGQVKEQQRKNKRLLAFYRDWLGRQKANYMCEVGPKNTQGISDFSLICRADGIESPEELLELSRKIFLAAPSTQIFLFADRTARNSVFLKQDNGGGLSSYINHISSIQENCSGLFTYDFVNVDSLLRVFEKAKDEDFSEVVRTGQYGNKYNSLVGDLDSLLSGKRIRVSEDLSSVYFEKITLQSKHPVKLKPEDLSHGELKKIDIYTWLKYKIPDDAVVLMDEVEIALHPDWQYQIVSDLVEWAPSNQYILATHSYDLCEALPPVHVKELGLKLKQREAA